MRAQMRCEAFGNCAFRAVIQDHSSGKPQAHTDFAGFRRGRHQGVARCAGGRPFIEGEFRIPSRSRRAVMLCTVAPSAVEEYPVAARAHATNHIAAPPIPAPSRKKRSSPGMTTSMSSVWFDGSSSNVKHRKIAVQ